MYNSIPLLGRSDATYDEWCKRLLPEDTLRTVGRFIVKQSEGGLATELKLPQAGGFNACVQMDFENSPSPFDPVPAARHCQVP